METFDQREQAVSITGIHVPFWSVVEFMVKWSIAAIPAMLILSLIFIAVEALIVGLFVHFFAPGSITNILRAYGLPS